MKPKTMWSLARSGRLTLLRSVTGLATPFYRACFIAAASRVGLLRLLGGAPRSLPEIARALSIGEAAHGPLAAWLDVGIGAKVLRRERGGYALAGGARALARPENDDAVALVEEMVALHRALLLETPERLQAGHPFALADHDAEVAARASRLLEPFVHEALAEVVPRRGPVRLLEIGCGSGTHVRAAAALNPELTALGLELSAAVAESARRNLESWGLSARATVEVADVRDRAPEARFDLATMHQNIYYFPEAEHARVLEHVRGFLRPGAQILLTTACRGGSPAMTMLSLWGAMTEGCSPLPDPDQVRAALARAGFRDVDARNLLAPADRFYAFVGKAP